MIVDDAYQVSKMLSFVLFLEQELEQELAEQKSLLRSVASRGEEILTQHSAAETSGDAGYVSKHFLSPRCCFPDMGRNVNISLKILF